MRTTLIALVVATFSLGCQSERAPAAAAAEAPAPASPWKAPAPETAGDRAARCVGETLRVLYASKQQEYGDPWKDPDTFAFFDADNERLKVAFLGGADTVDGAKARVEARLPLLKSALSRCETIAGLPAGKASENLLVTYSHLDRKEGTLKDVIMWQGGKFDFPPGAAAQGALDWLGALR